jgi:hypothetical protein
MNSAAMSSATHIAMEPTALQFADTEAELPVIPLFVVVSILPALHLESQQSF